MNCSAPHNPDQGLRGAFTMAKYDVRFKENAVKYYYKHGVAATRRKFDLSGNETVYMWVRKYETIGLMRKKNTTRTGKEKLKILEYYWNNGPAETEIQYHVAKGVLHVWNKLYSEHGIEGLEVDDRGKNINRPKNYDLMTDKEKIAFLELENEYLKKLEALVQQQEEKEQKKK